MNKKTTVGVLAATLVVFTQLASSCPDKDVVEEKLQLSVPVARPRGRATGHVRRRDCRDLCLRRQGRVGQEQGRQRVGRRGWGEEVKGQTCTVEVLDG
jgi:hypothetical protein